MLGALIREWLGRAPPALSAPPTHGALRRLCRYHARLFRRAAREPRRPAAQRRRAAAQARWIRGVLRHHPLNDDLARTIRQSADLLNALGAGTLSPGLAGAAGHGARETEKPA